MNKVMINVLGVSSDLLVRTSVQASDGKLSATAGLTTRRQRCWWTLSLATLADMTARDGLLQRSAFMTDVNVTDYRLTSMVGGRQFL